MKDPYLILGINQDATSDEIKEAYRKLAMKHHPDISKSSDAEIKMKEINQAYTMLNSDIQAQIRYPDFEDTFDNIFQQFNFNFSNMPRYNNISKGKSSLIIEFSKYLSDDEVSKIMRFVDNLVLGRTKYTYTQRV